MTPEPRVLLLASDAAVAEQVQRLAGSRESAGPAVGIFAMEGSVPETIARLNTSTRGQPIGLVVRTQEAVIAAIEGGADDACLATDLDLKAFVAFLDRVLLRARRRRDAENQQASIAHAARLTGLGTLVAGVAHEINNPLAVVVMLSEAMRSMTEPLLRAQEEILRLSARQAPATLDELRHLAAISRTGASSSELRRAFDDIDSALNTIRDIVRGLRMYARTGDDERLEPVSIADLVDQVVRVVGKQVEVHGEIERDYGPEVPTLLLPRSKMAQVLTNLLINAAQAIQQVERPIHRVRISVRCDDETLALSVSDTGPGISPENIERIFDPFFTTKRIDGPVGGSGLGLSISRTILLSLGGDLVAESVHGAGATFIALVPTEGRRVEPSAPPPAYSDRDTDSTPPRWSVLIVEDEEKLLRSLALALRRRFDVLLAGDGQEAIELLSSGSRADAVLCDVSMPLVDGAGLHEWLRANRPQLADRLVFMTASVDDERARRAAETGRPVLEKPVTRDRLIAVLQQILQ